MANDRMYLVCKGCKKAIMLAKTFADGYDLRKTPEQIQAFFDRHAFCNSEEHEPLKYQDFELRYESEDLKFKHEECVEIGGITEYQLE